MIDAVAWDVDLRLDDRLSSLRARSLQTRPSAYPPPSRPLQIVPELMSDELGAPSGARVGGSAAAGRLPNSEVGDVWAAGSSRQRWARRRAPPILARRLGLEIGPGRAGLSAPPRTWRLGTTQSPPGAGSNAPRCAVRPCCSRPYASPRVEPAWGSALRDGSPRASQGLPPGLWRPGGHGWPLHQPYGRRPSHPLRILAPRRAGMSGRSVRARRSGPGGASNWQVRSEPAFIGGGRRVPAPPERSTAPRRARAQPPTRAQPRRPRRGRVALALPHGRFGTRWPRAWDAKPLQIGPSSERAREDSNLRPSVP
jgi:hypothetical protein